MAEQPSSRVHQAIHALQALDREKAVSLLRAELASELPVGDRWRSIARLAGTIGELDIALEAARRVAATDPSSLDHLQFYASQLAGAGRTEEAAAQIATASDRHADDPSLLHFRATLMTEVGDFTAAEALYRQLLERHPRTFQSWFALAMIKTFVPGDPDIAAMERLLPDVARSAPGLYARFLYGLAKAYDDLGDTTRAWALYSEGAALRRREMPYNHAATQQRVDRLIAGYSSDALRSLTPSGHQGAPQLFVTGMPRSGTTLVEQILMSHSGIGAGGETGLFKAALLPTGDHGIQGARAYEHRTGEGDPWGCVARTYERLMAMRFGSGMRAVDKTVVQSHYMGLLLHALPQARVLWLRRDPEDTALSCFRSFFTSPLPWSWSLDDIAHFVRLEDRLHEHWTRIAGDRILTVPYEALVRDKDSWIPRILAHCGLAMEANALAPHRVERSVRTASVQQVRTPISTRAIGRSAPYQAWLSPFRAAYRS